MDRSTEPVYYFLHQIRIRKIVFDDSTDVTIFGSVPDDDDDENSIAFDFLCKFEILTDILLSANNKDESDLIIKIISEKLSVKLEIPTIIDIENIFGRELFFCNLVFKVSTPYEKDENGKLYPVRDNCYYIESVEDKAEFFKREGEYFNFKEHRKEIPKDLLQQALDSLEIIDNSNESKTDEEQFSEYLNVLDNAFKYYLQLLEKKFPEKEARERTGLNDELLFRIALLNNKILNK